jgi:hypothetical protein
MIEEESVTRRRAVQSPSSEDRQSLLFSDGDGTVDAKNSKDTDDDDSKIRAENDGNLTLMEQVVLMGMKDRQVPNLNRT